MDTKVLDFIRSVHPQHSELKKNQIEEGRLYIGPAHHVNTDITNITTDTTTTTSTTTATSKSKSDDDFFPFPSPSRIINESMYKTGVYVPLEYCDVFDDEWKSSMKKCFQMSNKQSQLQDFLTTRQSAGRLLKLQIMVLPPGTYFKIHAHPNIEFELTLKGTLEESRFQFCVPIEQFITKTSSSSSSSGGEKEEKQVDPNDSSASSSSSTALHGPTIKSTDMFVHNKVGPGQCMINEVGSVHQSYTGTECSCVILVLWSGCHANTSPEHVHSTDCRLKPTAGWKEGVGGGHVYI